MWDPYDRFERTVLDNGLTLHTAHWPGRLWETIGIVVHAGAREDPLGLEGVAHFMEHVLPDNAQPSIKKIKAFFDAHGGEMMPGATGMGSITYHCFTPIKLSVVEEALSLLTTMICAPKFDPIEHTRAIVRRELRDDFPSLVQYTRLLRRHRIIYAGTSAARMLNPLGSPQALRRISSADAAAFHKRYYVGQNVEIVAIGGLRSPTLLKIIGGTPLAALRAGTRNPLPKPNPALPPPRQKKFTTRHGMASTALRKEADAFAYSTRAIVPGTVNFWALELGSMMLNEILFSEIRERLQWAYAISAETARGEEFHEVAINSSLKLSALKDIEQVVAQCIASLGARADLLKQKKDYMLGCCGLIDMNGRGLRDHALNDLDKYHRLVELKETIQGITAVSMEDVQRAFAHLRPDRWCTQITLP